MSYKYASSLREHYNYKHEAVNLMCAHCGKIFKGERNLKHHVKRNTCRNKERKKERGKIYQCGVCHKTLSKRWNLVRHMETHNTVNNKVLDHEDKRLYRCTVCLWSFAKKFNYKRHMKSVHSSTKPYQCGVCGKELKTLDGLKSHMSNHK